MGLTDAVSPITSIRCSRSFSCVAYVSLTVVVAS